MLLKEIMTRPIEEVEPQMSLKEAAVRMKALDVGALPVCEGNLVVGMLTDRDIAIRGVAEGCDPEQARVADAMTPSVVYCYEDDDVREAARVMEEMRVRRVLVCDRNHRAVGIVSLGDIATRLRDERLSGEILESVAEMWHPMAG